MCGESSSIDVTLKSYITFLNWRNLQMAVSEAHGKTFLSVHTLAYRVWYSLGSCVGPGQIICRRFFQLCIYRFKKWDVRSDMLFNGTVISAAQTSYIWPFQQRQRNTRSELNHIFYQSMKDVILPGEPARSS